MPRSVAQTEAMKTMFTGPPAFPDSLLFSPHGEAKWVRGPSGLGASRAEEKGARRLAGAGVLDRTLSTASKRNEIMAVISCASTVGWWEMQAIATASRAQRVFTKHETRNTAFWFPCSRLFTIVHYCSALFSKKYIPLTRWPLSVHTGNKAAKVFHETRNTKHESRILCFSRNTSFSVMLPATISHDFPAFPRYPPPAHCRHPGHRLHGCIALPREGPGLHVSPSGNEKSGRVTRHESGLPTSTTANRRNTVKTAGRTSCRPVTACLCAVERLWRGWSGCCGEGGAARSGMERHIAPEPVSPLRPPFTVGLTANAKGTHAEKEERSIFR